MTHLLGRRPLQLARLRASGSAPNRLPRRVTIIAFGTYFDGIATWRGELAAALGRGTSATPDARRLRASHGRRWLPSSERSPGLLTGAAVVHSGSIVSSGSDGSSSKSTVSWSISTGEKPVIETSRPFHDQDLSEGGQLDCQELAVPAGIFPDLIVRKCEGAPLTVTLGVELKQSRIVHFISDERLQGETGSMVAASTTTHSRFLPTCGDAPKMPTSGGLFQCVVRISQSPEGADGRFRRSRHLVALPRRDLGKGRWSARHKAPVSLPY